jgi:hypothetical protein
LKHDPALALCLSMIPFRKTGFPDRARAPLLTGTSQGYLRKTSRARFRASRRADQPQAAWMSEAADHDTRCGGLPNNRSAGRVTMHGLPGYRHPPTNWLIKCLRLPKAMRRDLFSTG